MLYGPGFVHGAPAHTRQVSMPRSQFTDSFRLFFRLFFVCRLSACRPSMWLHSPANLGRWTRCHGSLLRRNPSTFRSPEASKNRRMASVAPATEGAGAEASSSGQPATEDPIVQWVVLRRDLWTDMGWPLGPVIAQACHACSAATFSHLDDDATRQYIAPENIDHMHKVGGALAWAGTGEA